MLVVLLSFLGATIYAWVNRYVLLEDKIANVLQDQGYDVTLQIESVGKTQAIVKNIKAKSSSLDGSAHLFLESETLILEYQWQDAIEGKVERAVIKSPKFFGEIDEFGALLFPAFPQSLFPKNSTSDASFVFPKNGIFVEEGFISLQNAGGKLELSADVVLQSFEAFTADLQIKPSALKIGGIEASFDGSVKISAQNGDVTVDTDVQLPTFKRADIEGVDLSLKANVILGIDTADVTIVGPTKLAFETITLPDYTLEGGALNWTGTSKITRPTEEKEETSWRVGNLSGQWESLIRNARVSADARRTDLAALLSLNATLSKTPLVKNFASKPYLAVQRLLNGASVDGAGALDWHENGYDIMLSKPLNVASKTDKVRVSPLPSGEGEVQSTLMFDRQNGSLTAVMDVKISGPSALEFNRFKLEALSADGLRLQGVKSVAARLSLPRAWQGQTVTGRTALLRPFQAEMRYVADVDARRFTLKGPFAYDGDVPGGYVTALKANGTTQVVAKADRVETRFTPKQGVPIEVASFENPTAWRGEQLELQIAPDGAVYVLRNTVGRLTTNILNVKGNWVDTVVSRHVDLNVESVNVIGTIAETLQNWRLTAKNATAVSPDVPSTGSKSFAPEASMVVRLRPDQAPEFSLETVQTNVSTEMVSATDMTLSVTGTPDAFKVLYRDGRAKFSAEDLPDLPFSGEVAFAASTNALGEDTSTWTGTAESFLPKVEDTPIEVEYTYSGGIARADVLIEELVFKPGQLQPQTLVSALKGKVSRVDGAVSAEIKLRFTPDMPLESSGRVSVKDMSFGTLTGPFAGLNTELQFDSMFPLKSAGRQKMTADVFDPGFPLENGAFEFEIIPNGVRLYSASWPLGGGVISVDPTDWIYNAPKNKVTMRLTDISVQSLTESLGKKNFHATGLVEGVLPVEIQGVQTNVVDGVLRVKNGGIIRFDTAYMEAAAAAAAAENEYAEMALNALKEFEYKKLEAHLDGPLDGNLIVELEFDGKNKDVLGGALFAWDVTVEGELVNIARSFSPENMNNMYKRVAQDAAKARQEEESQPVPPN